MVVIIINITFGDKMCKLDTRQYWLNQEKFYGISFMKCAYPNCYPVPADCSVYQSHCKQKMVDYNNYANSEWCHKCMLFQRHCNGAKIQIDESCIGE